MIWNINSYPLLVNPIECIDSLGSDAKRQLRWSESYRHYK
jgi:hypothetical protein